MISSMVAPASRFSNTADTGIRVSRNTHAPLSLPGTLSTAGHWDQSRTAIFFPPFIVASYYGQRAGSRGERWLKNGAAREESHTSAHRRERGASRTAPPAWLDSFPKRGMLRNTAVCERGAECPTWLT